MIPTNVDNGKRLRIKASFYEGEAGVIESGEGGEFACIAKAPPEASLPLDATLAGRAILITAFRPNPTQGAMIAARFVWAPIEGIEA